MQKILAYILILTMLLLIPTACQLKPKSGNEKPLIVTTIYPYELITRELVDTLFTVQTLLPPSASPHTWSPSPQDMLKLQKADVIIANGLGLETNLEKALTRFSTKLVIASTLVDKKMLLNDLDEPSQGNPNPHIWTSPALLTQIIIGLSNDLGKRYPMHKDAIAANARKTIMELNQVDSKIKLEKDRYPKATIVTLHDAFVYFFEYFKIDYIGSIQPSAGKDPAPKQLSDLADKVKANHIKSIYIEPQMNPKPAETLATELNLKVLKYDDLGTTLSAKTISEYLWQNWLSFKAGF